MSQERGKKGKSPADGSKQTTTNIFPLLSFPGFLQIRMHYTFVDSMAGDKNIAKMPSMDRRTDDGHRWRQSIESIYYELLASYYTTHLKCYCEIDVGGHCQMCVPNFCCI